jgi:hypothetical protein
MIIRCRNSHPLILEHMNNKKLIIGIAIVVVLVAIGAYVYQQTGFAFLTTTPSSDQTANVNSEEGRSEMESLVKEVGKLIVLPEGEDPTVATITDPSKLQDQPFFVNAKAGDKVLIYPTARKAFLYDPSAKKLVEVAPLVLGDPSRVIETPSTQTTP